MSDPIPSATADPDSDHAAHANAEDRKAAAALSSLNVNEITTDGVSDGANTNQDALGKAMSRLEIVGGQGQNTKGTNVQKSDGEVAKKKVVKVAAADVALLVRSDSPVYPAQTNDIDSTGGSARTEPDQGHRVVEGT